MGYYFSEQLDSLSFRADLYLGTLFTTYSTMSEDQGVAIAVLQPVTNDDFTGNALDLKDISHDAFGSVMKDSANLSDNMLFSPDDKSTAPPELVGGISSTSEIVEHVGAPEVSS